MSPRKVLNHRTKAATAPTPASSPPAHILTAAPVVCATGSLVVVALGVSEGNGAVSMTTLVGAPREEGLVIGFVGFGSLYVVERLLVCELTKEGRELNVAERLDERTVVELFGRDRDADGTNVGFLVEGEDELGKGLWVRMEVTV